MLERGSVEGILTSSTTSALTPSLNSNITICTILPMLEFERDELSGFVRLGLLEGKLKMVNKAIKLIIPMVIRVDFDRRWRFMMRGSGEELFK